MGVGVGVGVGVGSPTVTVIADEVVEAPVLSVTVATRLYVPDATLFHANMYGADATSPTLLLFAKKSTLEIVPLPSGSKAFATITKSLGMTSPLAGLAILTSGGELSG